MTKKLIFICLFIGSAIGGYVPAIWGGSTFSLSSVVWSGVGALVGIYIGFKFGQRFE